MTALQTHSRNAADPVYRRVAGVVLRKVAGETMLIPVRGRIAELQNLFVLDEVGEVIWTLLSEARPVADVAREVALRFHQPMERVLPDCAEFLEALKAEGLVEAP